jgi:hypothetical protein
MEPIHEVEDLSAADEPEPFRDTLVFWLGKMAEAIVTRAFQEARVQAEYQEWLGETVASKNARLLVTAGIDHGTVSLYARTEKDEFILKMDHPRFDAMLALGYSAARADFQGFILAHFQGSLSLAVHFCRSLYASVGNPVEDCAERRSPGPGRNLN